MPSKSPHHSDLVVISENGMCCWSRPFHSRSRVYGYFISLWRIYVSIIFLLISISMFKSFRHIFAFTLDTHIISLKGSGMSTVAEKKKGKPCIIWACHMKFLSTFRWNVHQYTTIVDATFRKCHYLLIDHHTQKQQFDYICSTKSYLLILKKVILLCWLIRITKLMSLLKSLEATKKETQTKSE